MEWFASVSPLHKSRHGKIVPGHGRGSRQVIKGRESTESKPNRTQLTRFKNRKPSLHPVQRLPFDVSNRSRWYRQRSKSLDIGRDPVETLSPLHDWQKHVGHKDALSPLAVYFFARRLLVVQTRSARSD